jgi:hypothetical protein
MADILAFNNALYLKKRQVTPYLCRKTFSCSTINNLTNFKKNSVQANLKKVINTNFGNNFFGSREFFKNLVSLLYHKKMFSEIKNGGNQAFLT